MNIQGLQKLTLLDYPGLVACTVFTAGCNYRCPFCHNSSLVINPERESIISRSELLEFLKKRTGIIDGVCFTGGEPLLQEDLAELMTEIKKIGYKIKLDTNGSLPDRLAALIKRNLPDFVAMDIKNSKERYAETTGIPGVSVASVNESAFMLMNGSVPFEFRTTIVREFHTEQDIRSIGSWLRGDENYYLQNFVDSGDLIKQGLSGFTEEESNHFLSVLREYIPNAHLRGI